MHGLRSRIFILNNGRSIFNEYVTTLLSKLESIQAGESLKSKEKLSIWVDPMIERDEDEKATKEKNELVIQLLMIYYILSKHLDTDDTLTTYENTNEGETDEDAKEAINAKAGEEITLEFS